MRLPEDHLPPDHELPECPGCGALLSENAHRCPAGGARPRRPGGPGSEVSPAVVVTMILVALIVGALFFFVFASV